MAPGNPKRQKSFIIRKGEMRYIFRYAPEREAEALQALLGLTGNEGLNLTRRDASNVLRHLGYNPEGVRLRKEA